MLHSTFLFMPVFSCLSLPNFDGFLPLSVSWPMVNSFHSTSYIGVSPALLPVLSPNKASSSSTYCFTSNTWPGNEVSAERLSQGLR